jgi:hypothetical protein
VACHITDEHAQRTGRGWWFNKFAFVKQLQLAEFYGEHKHLKQYIHAVQQSEHALGIDVCHLGFCIFYLFELAETYRACLPVFIKPCIFLIFEHWISM